MSKFCTNCGSALKESVDVCLNCGRLVVRDEVVVNNVQSSDGKVIGTLSIVFGALGFYPLIFIGSIIGIILGFIGLTSASTAYKGRAKVGLWISISTFVLWIILIIVIVYVTANNGVYN